MKNLSLLVWLTQLGLSVVMPLAGFILLAVWLQKRLALGNWVIWVGIGLGLVSALNSLRLSLRTLSRMCKDDTESKEPPVYFNEHD